MIEKDYQKNSMDWERARMSKKWQRKNKNKRKSNAWGMKEWERARLGHVCLDVCLDVGGKFRRVI